MGFIPNFSLPTHLTILISAILIFGLIGGEITKLNPILPKILGYILVGFLVGPSVLNLTTESFIYNAHTFIDIALGLLLFELGRHLDIDWLRHDYNLLFIALTESGLTFLLTFTIFKCLQLSWLASTLAAGIMVVTSPAIVMMVAHDLSAQGPVTRRMFILTSLNNFFGLVLFTLFLPFAQKNIPTNILFLHSVFHFFGSIALGLTMFLLLMAIAWLVGKNKENQFIACASVITLAIALSYLFGLSVMLVVFIFGFACRNLDKKHLIMEINFLWLAQIFLIFLFVMAGMLLNFRNLLQLQVIFTGLLLIFVRIAAKIIGVYAFSKKANLTLKQSFFISISLLPMASMTLGMLNTTNIVDMELGQILSSIIVPVLSILSILTPISTQFCLIKAGETDNQK